MNNFIRHIYCVVLILMVTHGRAVAQKDGVVAPEVSAIEHLFQPTKPWSGGRYTSALNYVGSRFYINGSGGYGQTWGYNSPLNRDMWGVSSKIGLGYRIAPVHAFEIAGGWNFMNMESDFTSLEANYLFNITSYASRIETPKRWELEYLLGVESQLRETPVVTLHSGVRLKYNVSPSLGVYAEPRIGTYLNDTNFGDVVTTMSLGVSITPARIKESIEYSIKRRKAMWASTRYEIVPVVEFKTNLLYDAATILNVEMEIPMGKRVSFAAEWVFPWWTNDDSTIYSKRNRTQLLNGTVELKYWFGNRRNRRVLTGWYAGVFTSGGLYDFERSGSGYQGEFFVAAGVGGGYAHTINKRENLRLEYSVGFGYLQTDYSYYEAFYDTDDLRWRPIILETGRYSILSPLRLKASLGWMITRKKKL